MAAQLRVGLEPIPLEKRPDLFAIAGNRFIRSEARKKPMKILDISQQELLAIWILCGIHRLGKIDYDRAVVTSTDWGKSITTGPS